MVCKDRLPAMADRKQLPYLGAILAEVLRWISIAPVSAYHHPPRPHYMRHTYRPSPSLARGDEGRPLRRPPHPQRRAESSIQLDREPDVGVYELVGRNFIDQRAVSTTKDP